MFSNPLFKTFLLSMTPLGELRAGIPYGLFKEINPILTFIVAVTGNMVPVIFLLWGLPQLEKWLKAKALAFSFYKHNGHQKAINNTANNFKRLQPKFLSFLSRAYFWYKFRTARKYSQRFQKLGALALITFVAIPLPITGAWTGSLAAYIFNIPPQKALPLIGLGVMIAGIITSLIALNIF